MSSASPTDLTVAFRSFARRRREILGDAAPQVVAGVDDDGARLLAEAGALLGTAADPLAIADAIEATPADHWDKAVLQRLGAIALELGGWLRRLAAGIEPD
jgi:hypothetical protein